MRPNPPTLYRVSRLLRRLSVVALVLVVAYLGIAAYSATQLRVDTSHASVSTQVTADTATLTAGINVSNRGWVSISGLSVTTAVRLSSGLLVGIARSPETSIGPGAQMTVPISISVSLNASSSLGSALVSLLTQSQSLPAFTWANATYAGLATISIQDDHNLSWGAPFAHLNVTPGTPGPGPNGSVREPFTISFTNEATFGVDGQLSVRVTSSSGTTCGTGTLAVHAPPGTAFNQNLGVDLAPSCNPSGGTAYVSFVGSGFNAVLPPQRLP